MTGLGRVAPHNNSMIDIFTPRFKVATRAIGMTDVLSPHQVCTFSDCEVRWFYEHLLGLPDPPTANLAGCTPSAPARRNRCCPHTHRTRPYRRGGNHRRYPDIAICAHGPDASL